MMLESLLWRRVPAAINLYLKFFHLKANSTSPCKAFNGDDANVSSFKLSFKNFHGLQENQTHKWVVWWWYGVIKNEGVGGAHEGKGWKWARLGEGVKAGKCGDIIVIIIFRIIFHWNKLNLWLNLIKELYLLETNTCKSMQIWRENEGF